MKTGKWQIREKMRECGRRRKHRGEKGQWELFELLFCRRGGQWAQPFRRFSQSCCLHLLTSGSSVLSGVRLFWQWRLVFQLKCKVTEVAAVCGYFSSCGVLPHEVSVLCLSQSLIWVITFCLHKFHGGFSWRHFKACLLFAESRGGAPENTLLRFWFPAIEKGRPSPSSGGCQPCCQGHRALSQMLPRSNLLSFQIGNWAPYDKHTKPLWEVLCCLPKLEDGLAEARRWQAVFPPGEWTLRNVYFPWVPGPACKLCSFSMPFPRVTGRQIISFEGLPASCLTWKVAPGSAPAYPVLCPHQNQTWCLEKGAPECRNGPGFASQGSLSLKDQ